MIRFLESQHQRCPCRKCRASCCGTKPVSKASQVHAEQLRETMRKLLKRPCGAVVRNKARVFRSFHRVVHGIPNTCSCLSVAQQVGGPTASPCPSREISRPLRENEPLGGRSAPLKNECWTQCHSSAKACGRVPGCVKNFIDAWAGPQQSMPRRGGFATSKPPSATVLGGLALGVSYS